MKEILEQEIVELKLSNGVVPFKNWFNRLRDKTLRSSVEFRLTQVRSGNFGDFKSVGGGVFELRIHRGPGLRIYYGKYKKQIVVLIGGGSKSSQQKDVETAKRLWKEFKREIGKL